MAIYYWVGGTGTWDNSSTTNWSTTSGGTGGAGYPLSIDDVIFDTNSGTGTITSSSSNFARCSNFTWSTTSSFIFLAGSPNVYGNITITSGASNCGAAITLSAITTGKTITTNGYSIAKLTFNGVGGEWTLQDNLTTTYTLGFSIIFGAGTLNSNDKTITSPGISISGSSIKILNLGFSNVLFKSWQNTSTNLTITGFYTLVFNASSGLNQFLPGSNFVYNNLKLHGTGQLRIANSTTFNNITNDVSPTTLRLNGNIIVTNLALVGSAGNLVTINSYTGIQYRITQTTGTAAGNYLYIRNIATTGGAYFYAGANSTDGGGNLGWIFSNAPPPTTSGFFYF